MADVTVWYSHLTSVPIALGLMRPETTHGG
jgi:hypothetical protein